jgi:hypothetical protein
MFNIISQAQTAYKIPSELIGAALEAQRQVSSDMAELVGAAQTVYGLPSEFLRAAFESQRQVSSDIFNVIGEAKRIASSDIFDSLRRMADEIGETDIEVSEADLAELKLVITRPEFVALSIYDKIKELLAYGVKHPTTRKVVIFFALSFVVWAFEQCCDAVKHHYLGQRPKQVVRDVRNLVRESQVPIDWSDYRVVAKDGLAARQSHKKKSAALDTLDCGKLVRLIEKRSKVSLVLKQAKPPGAIGG